MGKQFRIYCSACNMRRCVVCGSHAVVALCDGETEDGTCDAPMCSSHRNTVALVRTSDGPKRVDLCPKCEGSDS